MKFKNAIWYCPPKSMPKREAELLRLSFRNIIAAAKIDKQPRRWREKHIIAPLEKLLERYQLVEAKDDKHIAAAGSVYTMCGLKIHDTINKRVYQTRSANMIGAYKNRCMRCVKIHQHGEKDLEL